MILIDSVNHRILDVMKDRGAVQLRAYFNQYSPAARAVVKTITVDLFPYANIVADRFHILTQAYRELNKVRISVMKQFESDSKEYRQLKHFWKLLMKHENALDYTTRISRANFKHAYLTDKEVSTAYWLSLMNCVTHTLSIKGFFTPSKLVMKLNSSPFYAPQKMMPNTAHCQRQ